MFGLPLLIIGILFLITAKLSKKIVRSELESI
jgi:hypothetical protein